MKPVNFLLCLNNQKEYVIILELLPSLLLILAFIVTIIEYVLLRKMVPSYYKNGPFALIEASKSIHAQDILLERLKNEGSISIKPLQDSILVFFNPSILFYLARGEFLTQKIVLKFISGHSGPEIRYEVRPFYSAFLLSISIVLFIIVDVILPNQYANIPFKIVGIIVACLIGFAIFLPFGPRRDIINRVKKFTT